MAKPVVPMHKVVRWLLCRERDGWGHEVLFEMLDGTQLHINDDTDDVTAFADKSGPTAQEVAALWSHYEFGSSSFGRKLQAALKQNEYSTLANLEEKVYSGSGVKLSYIAEGKEDEFPRYSVKIELSDDERSFRTIHAETDGKSVDDAIDKAVASLKTKIIKKEN